MIGRTRPSACPEGHAVRKKGERWWCWTCDREVEPLARSRPKLARTRVRPRSDEATRATKRLRSYGTDERMAWLHSQPCVAQGCGDHVCHPWDMEVGRAYIQAVHVVPRCMGAAKGGADDQVPGCDRMHREAGEHGTAERAAFEARTGLDLVARAADYAEAWRNLAQPGASVLYKDV